MAALVATSIRPSSCKVRNAPSQVAVETILKRGEHPSVPVVVEASQVSKFFVPCSLEAINVLRRFRGSLRRVRDEVVGNQWIGKLLGKHRRDADGEAKGHPFVS